MFTGIVEEMGEIRAIHREGRGCRLEIGAAKVLEGTQLGDSIAVNGTCLTVTQMGKSEFFCDVTAETMKRTAFSLFQAGTKVNLERALTLSTRLGGHIVLGHVDGTATIISKKKVDNAVHITFETDPNYRKYVVEKGSIAVDGISLTVAEKRDFRFSVALIPHTGEETTLLMKKVGDIVNIEYDYVGKYIEQLMNRSEGEGLSLRDLEKYNLGGHYGV